MHCTFPVNVFRATFDRYGEEGLKGNVRRHSASDHAFNSQFTGFPTGNNGGSSAGGRHTFGHIDPFELFRSFFGTGDPFNAFDHFGMHHHHHHHLNSGRTDPWYRRHLLSKRLRIFCPKISPENSQILLPLKRTSSCWL